MAKKSTLLVAALLAAGFASAQKMSTGYVVKPDGTLLQNYVSMWNGGSGTIKMDANGSPTASGAYVWEDQEFYTSRVKPRKRFYNTATQVRPNLVRSVYNKSTKTYTSFGNDKRVIYWVPCNSPAFNALPDGTMDSEAFSMWNYLDVYGNWTCGYGFVPGAFTDAAHKNGVSVHGVAQPPNGALQDYWKTCWNALYSLGSSAFGKFLLYHGVDGLGYNSEWTSGGAPNNFHLIDMHDELFTYMDPLGTNPKNPLWEVMWYGGTNDNGSCAFDTGLSNNTKLFKSSSFFMNYNWKAYMSSAIQTAKNMNRDPLYCYAGMNMQGGEGYFFSSLVNNQYSIGLWGAHEFNMYWQGRGKGGTTVEATQRYYLNTTETWFTGGSHNPAIRQTVNDQRGLWPTDDWAGISALKSAGSTLQMYIESEPFYTFFNIGNGSFFNWKGNRVSNNQWYNLGIQDQLPTWRWWWAPSLLDGDISASDVHMNAEITWEDAFVGGSCLKITGSTSEEYLHLFKTDITLDYNERIVVRYKVLGGSGNVNLIMTQNYDPTEVNFEAPMVTTKNIEDLKDISYKEGGEGWIEQVFYPEDYLDLDADDANIALIALKVTNASNLEILLGELSILSENDFATPYAPIFKSQKVLKNTYSGVDGKLFWSMANNKAAGTPCYNSDVKTSFFKVYAQEEGCDPVFVGATNQWASVIFQGPNTKSTAGIRFGVSAVSLDTRNESAITWAPSYLAKGSYEASSDFDIDKKMIKANEGFRIYYLDERHSSSTWTLVNNEGSVVASSTGIELSVPNGLPLGGYDLYIDRNTTNERAFAYFVQVTNDGVGALPEIYTISNDNGQVSSSDSKVTIDLGDKPLLSYTGRKADGSASRCIGLNSEFVGSSLASLGGTSVTQGSITFGGWFLFKTIPDDSWNFLNIVAKTDGWPKNEWGWAWNYGDKDGGVHCVFRGNTTDGGQPGELHYEFPDTKLTGGVWTHIMLSCERSGNNFRAILWINGVKQKSTWFQYASGNNGTKKYDNKTTDDWCVGQTITPGDNAYVLFGGQQYQHSQIDGYVDDFQVWNKAVTAEDVKLSMNGITAANAPTGLLALWDFETAANNSHYFAASCGSAKATATCSNHNWNGTTEGAKSIVPIDPFFESGCPFLSGTAYPVVTEAVWKDSDRRTQFQKQASRATTTEGEGGAARVNFVNAGDHQVSLTLKNNYGESTMSFPVYEVIDQTQGIGDIATDAEGDFNAYAQQGILYLEFAADGSYDVQVYNTAGMLAAAKTLNATAGQNARINLGTPGVYVVKVVKDGKVLRTLKVLSE